MEKILEGKKIDDNLEDTSASEEASVVGEGTKTEPIPSLSSSPVPTPEEKHDAGLDGSNGIAENIDAKPEADGDLEEGGSEPELGNPELGSSEVSESEATPIANETAPIENVADERVEENGVVEMPATKVFTQSQVNDMIGNTRTETREKTFRYIYDRYGVKSEAELDELVGNAQALDSFKERYEAEKADWKKTGSERDRELEDVKEQVALLQSGINNDRFEDAKFILRGKGLEVNLDNIKAELATHPEWQNKGSEEAGNPNFVKTGEPNINAGGNAPAEPSSKISVLGNEAVGGNEGANSEEDYALNRFFKV